MHARMACTRDVIGAANVHAERAAFVSRTRSLARETEFALAIAAPSSYKAKYNGERASPIALPLVLCDRGVSADRGKAPRAG